MIRVFRGIRGYTVLVFSVPVLIVMFPSRCAIPSTSRGAAASFHEASARTRDRLRCASRVSNLLMPHEHEISMALKSSGADPSPPPCKHRRQKDPYWLGSGRHLVKVEDGLPGPAFPVQPSDDHHSIS